MFITDRLVWGWWRLLFGGLALVGMATATISDRTSAQVVPDTTLPDMERSQVSGEPLFKIDGGAKQGNNLFHSFQKFSVPTGGTAFFNNAPSIVNIFSRVTGAFVSHIDGLILVNGRANLFLLNPNGIILGPNASLNIGGSFLATTAHAIQFEEQGFFSAIAPNIPSLLKVNPSALIFNQIAVQPIISQASLLVPTGQSLLLVGGNVHLDGSKLRVPEGRVELGGVAGTGTVGLNIDGSNLSLNFPGALALSDVSLTNRAQVNVRAGGGGSIAINALNLNLAGGSILRTGIDLGMSSAVTKAGNIDINVLGAITLTNGSLIENTVLGTGNGGDINITTGSLSVTDGAKLNASTSGRGNSGSVTIRAAGAVSFDGEDSNQISSAAISRVNLGAEGNSGGINITAESLSVTNGAFLSTSTREQGNAGSVTISVRDRASFDGIGTDGFPSGALSNVLADAKGDSGGINLTAGSLSVTNGALLNASTYGRGNAGTVRIRVADAAVFAGQSSISSDTSSGVYSLVGTNPLSTNAVGDSGGIDLIAGSLFVTDGAQLQTTTSGRGNAGRVTLQVSGAAVFAGETRDGVYNSGAFSLVRYGAVGNSGGVYLTARSLSATGSARLATTTSGQGNAGSLIIRVTDAASFDGVSRQGNSSSGAFSRSFPGAVGDSGNLNITAGSLSVINGATLTASTNGLGNAGSVTISVHDRVSLSGVRPDGLPGGIFSSVLSMAIGKSDGIDITASSLSMTDGAVISAQSQGTGRAGSITLNLKGTLQTHDGQISTSSAQSSGGAIAIFARDIRLFGNSNIITSVFSGEGGGGDINLSARSILAFNDSNILAFSRDGSGGNINLKTPIFFGFRYYPAPKGTDPATLIGNGRVDINATGRISSGIITLPDVTPVQNSLTPLPTNVIDTNSLLANSCIVRNPQQRGSFTITGSGGLPRQPNDAANGAFETYTLVPTSDTAATNSTQRAPRRHQLVEAQGVYRLPNGQLILSRECSR